MNINDIEEVVNYINSELEKGRNLKDIEVNDFGVNERVIAKRLSRRGYKRINNKYLLDSNTNETQDVTNRVKSNNFNLNSTNRAINFTDEEMEILRDVINLHRKMSIDDVDYKDSEVVNRSFRTYKKAIDKFTEYCSQNRLSQKESLAIALFDFIKK